MASAAMAENRDLAVDGGVSRSRRWSVGCITASIALPEAVVTPYGDVGNP